MLEADSKRHLLKLGDFSYSDIFFAVFFVAAALVRIIWLSTPSVSPDELISYYTYAKKPLLDIVFIFDDNNHHVLYNLLTHLTGFFITNPLVNMRWVAFVSGLLSILFLYLIVRKHVSIPVAFLVCLVMMFLPQHIAYSAQGRGYTLQMFLVLLSMSLIFTALKDKSDEKCSGWSAVCMALAVYAVSTTAVFVLAQFLALLIVYRKRKSHLKKIVKTYILTFIIALILYLPMILKEGILFPIKFGADYFSFNFRLEAMTAWVGNYFGTAYSVERLNWLVLFVPALIVSAYKKRFNEIENTFFYSVVFSFLGIFVLARVFKFYPPERAFYFLLPFIGVLVFLPIKYITPLKAKAIVCALVSLIIIARYGNMLKNGIEYRRNLLVEDRLIYGIEKQCKNVIFFGQKHGFLSFGPNKKLLYDEILSKGSVVEKNDPAEYIIWDGLWTGWYYPWWYSGNGYDQKRIYEKLEGMLRGDRYKAPEIIHWTVGIHWKGAELFEPMNRCMVIKLEEQKEPEKSFITRTELAKFLSGLDEGKNIQLKTASQVKGFLDTMERFKCNKYMLETTVDFLRGLYPVVGREKMVETIEVYMQKWNVSNEYKAAVRHALEV